MNGRIVKTYAVGLIWALGLLLAGSDNVYMPWPNLFGIAMFGFASRLMNGKSLGSKRFFLKLMCRPKNTISGRICDNIRYRLHNEFD